MNKLLKQIIVLVLVTSTVSCSEKETEKRPEKTIEVYKVMPVLQRQINGSLKQPGSIQPFEQVQLYPKVSGFVKSVHVDRGAEVKKGQVLVTLEAPESEQQVAAAKLRYTQAEAGYRTSKDRYRRLSETSNTPGTVSPYDLEAARSKMQADSATALGEYANYKAQESIKNYLTVTAPFDGVITERNVHPGALVGPGMQGVKPMLVLQQLSHLRLVVEIPEQYSMQVTDGETVSYKINALPGQDFKGTVSRSSKSISNSFRSETIEVDIDNKENKFKSGMYAEVVIPVSGSINAFVVPKSAIVTTTERKYVVALEQNIAKWIDITEGNQGNDSTEVFGRLENNVQIIVNPSYRIQEGERIRN